MTTCRTTPSTRWWLGLALAITLIKLWLTRAQPVFAISNAALDDRLFLELAQSLVRGDWLGSYSQATLAKGPAYPLFISLVFYLGIPLGLAQQMLYAGACGLFTRAISPVTTKSVQFGIYALLLWNPMTYEAPTMGRIMRQHLVTPLGIIIFAGFLALYLRQSKPWRHLWPWAVTLGTSLGIFWLTREEAIWIVPSLILLSAAVLFSAWQLSNQAFRLILSAGTLAGICMLIPIQLVSWQNYQHYGWYGTVEVKAREFQAAYGALQRVIAPPEFKQVPVSKHARETLYPYSPAFQSLQPWLERNNWTHESAPPEGRQIRGGWFIWALRESVQLSGHAPDAKSALQFYQKLANEINEACDSGSLNARPQRDSLIPVIHEGQVGEIIRTFSKFADFVATYGAFSAAPKLSIGDREELKLFHDMTRDEISSSPRAPSIERPNQEAMRTAKQIMLQRIGTHLCSALIVLGIVAQCIAIIRMIQVIMARRLTYPIVLAAAAWGGIASFLGINAIVHVLSFPLIAVSTFSPIYPLMLIFIIAVGWDASSAWMIRRQN